MKFQKLREIEGGQKNKGKFTGSGCDGIGEGDKSQQEDDGSITEIVNGKHCGFNYITEIRCTRKNLILLGLDSLVVGD